LKLSAARSGIGGHGADAKPRTRKMCCTLAAVGLALSFAPQAESQNTDLATFSIRLEQKKGSVVVSVPQTTVFHNGDILRFQLVSRTDGYLYVVDKGSTGSNAVLFPAGNGAADNHIQAKRSYLVPAEGDGWFEVSGPSGFDTLYFLVSVTSISLPPSSQPGEPKAPQPQVLPPDLLPRCNDEIFKARGECLDGSAGVAPLAPDAAVPRELVPFARTASRDIVLTDDGDDTNVQAASSAKLPLIYTFRLAHRE
jgi:hypothetical protein